MPVSFISAANRIGATPETEYSSIFNGYSVTLPGNQVDKLLKLPGVTAIYPNNEVHALADSTNVQTPVNRTYSDSGKLIGADVLHTEGYTGEGVQVAVVDTGIDYKHPLLKDNYKGGYDAVDKDNDPYETEDPDDIYPDKGTSSYETSHGTHVSGTILDIAPDADLYVYRVLGPYGSGTTENVIAGIEQAVLDGADVINLSLGSDMNQSYSADSIAIDNAVKSGVNVVVAAGNAGPDEATLGSPAGAQLALTVGASTVPVTTPFFDIGNLKKIPGLIATYSPELTEDISGLSVVYAGLGTPADFANIDATGKVVLVDRGAINFSAKALNAKAAGAKLLLIANNTAGELGATLGAPGDFPPTFGITQANGTLIKAELAAGRTSISYVPVTEKNQLADFSSTGPGYPDYLLKPDVVAPGVSINSTVPIWESTDGTYDTAFGLKQGTSMATPHVVGAVALLKGEYPDLNPEQIKALLMNNADPIVDRDSEPYSLYQQGAGLINLIKSANAGSIAKVGEIFNSGLPGSVDIPYYTGSFSFGLQSKGASVTKAVYVEEFNTTAQSYNVSLDWLTDEPNGITVSTAPSLITAGSGTGNYIPITLAVDAAAPDGAYEAILKLESGSEVLRLPLNILVGDKYNLEPVNQLGLDDTEISPNGDGRFDKTGFYFSVNQDLSSIRFVATSLDAPTTVIGDVYSSDETVYRGAHEFLDWGGTVTNPETSDVSVLPDGHYLITPIFPGNTWAYDQAILFTVDTEKPTSSGYSLEEYDRESPEDDRYAYISGTIDDDLLVDLISSSRTVSSLFSVYAVGKDFDGTLSKFSGTIDNYGNFGIDVPVNEGVNDYLVYVTDSAGNGQDEDDYSQHLIYNTEDGGISVAPKVSASTIEVGQSVTVDVSFSATDAVYGVNGAALGIIYNDTLGTPTIKTSVQLATYQEQKFTGIPLEELTNTSAFDEGYKLTQYAVQLSEGAAYTGAGSLVQFTFTPTAAGTYSFELYGVQIWNDGITTTIPSSISNATITVTAPVTTVNPDPVTSNPGPTITAPAPGTVASGLITETADPAGGKPAAKLAVSDTALNAALQITANSSVVLNLSDVDFSKYGQVSIALTPAQADKLKTSAKALNLNGKGFSLIIPAGTLPDFITASGLAVTLSLNAEADTALLNGTTKSIDIGSSSLTIKNGWKTSKPVFVQLALNPDGLKDVRKTGIYQKTADGTWAYLQPGTLPADDLLQFSITGDGTYTAAARNTTFSDIGTHWAKDAVEVLAAHGIVAG
ncbi:hypothetical protein KC345_g10515, partial [Hortaea werneckii]